MSKTKAIVDRALKIGRVNAKMGVRTVSRFPAHNKVGLGLGVTSLGLGLVNMKNHNATAKANQDRVQLEQKSLAALNKIHRALADKKE